MKKLVLITVLVMASMMSNASYLYWQVTNSNVPEQFSSANYAVLCSINSDRSVVTELRSVSISEFSDGSTDSIDLSQLRDVSSLSFFVELQNYDESTGKWTTLAVSDDYYSTSALTKYIDTGLTPATPAQVWHGGTFIIPEPTTGLLVTVGMGLLALRRRRKIGIAG